MYEGVYIILGFVLGVSTLGFIEIIQTHFYNKKMKKYYTSLKQKGEI